MAYSAQQYWDWPDGKPHSIPYAQHQANVAAPKAPPPPGTYDPALDYEQGAADRGYGNTADDAATAYQRGQQQYGQQLGALTTSRDQTLADLLTQSSDTAHQYDVLGHQQVQAANHQGVTSAGLLGLSAAARAGNQATDQAKITTAEGRADQAFNTGKTNLDLNNAYQFGGYGGNQITNPLTGQPEAGDLVTGLTRAGIENSAYQTGILGQKVQQAQAGGYVTPPAATIPSLAASQDAAQTRFTASQAAASARAAAALAAAKKKPKTTTRTSGARTP